MTRKHNETITCPKCGQPFDVELYDSINAQLSPELAEKLYTNEYHSLFDTCCPKCGYEATLQYPVLFNDMDASVMVQFNPDYEHEMRNLMDFAREVDHINADMEKHASFSLTKECRFRFVSNFNDFREKAIIFRDGYDDRLIEIVKLILLMNIGLSNPDMGVDGLYYTDRNQDTFVFTGFTDEGRGFEAEIPIDAYESAERMLESSTLDDKEPLMVDHRFAVKILQER